MILIGITGGVGMGKSTAQSLLQRRSIPVIDTDELARTLVEPGQPALAEIIGQFGPAFLTAEGGLDRAAMAQRVFKDAACRHQLEAILHPRIRACWMTETEAWRGQGVRLGAVIIPLLFETNAASLFGAVACVACSPAAQQQRLKARGWSAPEIQQRLAAQWPVEQKIASSDYVVWTDGDLQVHAQQWDRILQAVSGQKTGGHCWPPETKPS